MELPDYIGTYFDECGHRRPCEQELREIILKLVSTIPFGITIIIDGLDECKDFEGLLSGLFEIRDAGEIKMVITTRQDPDIAPHSDDLFEMHVLPSLVADDIALFVAHEVERRKTLKSLRSDLKDEVTRVVIEEANGV